MFHLTLCRSIFIHTVLVAVLAITCSGVCLLLPVARKPAKMDTVMSPLDPSTCMEKEDSHEMSPAT